MSRCFPFPPPGYERNGSCGEALIELIKLQRETEKANKDRKKEKRREKKEKNKRTKGNEVRASHASDAKVNKRIEEEGYGCLQKGDDYENRHHERSDITEEHDQPVTSDLSYLSDNTQRSKKRKRSTLPCNPDNGTVSKIRLPLRKHGESQESKPEDQLCSTSRSVGAVNSFFQDSNGSHNQLQIITNTEKVCLGNSASTTNSLAMVSSYNSLFQNWVPPPLGLKIFKSECEDWLFGSKLQQNKPSSVRVTSTSDSCRCSVPSQWPCAQYLPEVESYALPYAIPF